MKDWHAYWTKKNKNVRIWKYVYWNVCSKLPNGKMQNKKKEKRERKRKRKHTKASSTTETEKKIQTKQWWKTTVINAIDIHRHINLSFLESENCHLIFVFLNCNLLLSLCHRRCRRHCFISIFPFLKWYLCGCVRPFVLLFAMSRRATRERRKKNITKISALNGICAMWDSPCRVWRISIKINV